MAYDIFSGNPRSFKLNRRSALASKLKSSIMDKLNHFLAHYTDDVLAEYIVVLVCNGKDQNQARDELEAFLGKRSAEFISWLWYLLLETVDQSHMTIGSSNREDVIGTSRHINPGEDEHKPFSSRDHLNHSREDFSMLSEDQYCRKIYAQKLVSSNKVEYEHGITSNMEVYEGCRHIKSGSDASRDEIYNKEVRKPTFKYNTSEKSGSTDDKCCEIKKNGSSTVELSSRNSTSGEESLLYVDQHKKMISCYRDGLPHRPLYPPKREQFPSNVQSTKRENRNVRSLKVTVAAGRRFSSIAAENPKPRGNVWDRLGRPPEDNNFARSKKIEVQPIDVLKPKSVQRHVEDFNHNRPKLFVPTVICNNRVMRETPVPDKYRRPERDISRKRQLSEIGPTSDNASIAVKDKKGRHLRDAETLEESQTPSSAKCSHSQILNNVASGTTKTGEPQTNQTCKSSDNALSPSLKNISQIQLVKNGPEAIPTRITQRQSSAECSHSQILNNVVSGTRKTGGPQTKQTCISSDNALSPSLKKVAQIQLVKNGPETTPTRITKPGFVSADDGMDTDVKPLPAGVVDIKQRFHQIEMEMTKLRSKQVDTDDGKPTSLLSSDTLSHSEEEVETRTVFVTNVHFAATKEALSMHFAKCGGISRVTILYDVLTAQPKGAAYVIFTSKESADKAVAMSGTSFWSRTLKVTKKAEIPAPPTQLIGKFSWSQFPLPSRNVLQWRRQELNVKDNCVSASGMNQSVPNC